MAKLKEDYGVLGKVLFKDNYKKALVALKDVLARKKEKGHDIYYYASRIAKSFKGVEPRRLAAMVSEQVWYNRNVWNDPKLAKEDRISPDILPKAGAGQDGTDTLVKSYMRDTPGQNKIKNFKDYIK